MKKILAVARQLPLAPMRILAVGIEHALNVAVQCPHDTNPRKHRRTAVLDHQHQRLDRGLPFRGVVLRLGKPGDLMGRVAQRDERLPVRQRDRFRKLALPTFARHQTLYACGSARAFLREYLTEREAFGR
jgi:hypothetical protein